MSDAGPTRRPPRASGAGAHPGLVCEGRSTQRPSLQKFPRARPASRAAEARPATAAESKAPIAQKGPRHVPQSPECWAVGVQSCTVHSSFLRCTKLIYTQYHTHHCGLRTGMAKWLSCVLTRNYRHILHFGSSIQSISISRSLWVGSTKNDTIRASARAGAAAAVTAPPRRQHQQN